MEVIENEAVLIWKAYKGAFGPFLNNVFVTIIDAFGGLSLVDLI